MLATAAAASLTTTRAKNILVENQQISLSFQHYELRFYFQTLNPSPSATSCEASSANLKEDIFGDFQTM